MKTKNNFPLSSHRDEFLTVSDFLLDKIFSKTFPEISKEVGIDLFQKNAYPKCDIINFDDRVQIIAEIPGITKEQLTIDVDGDIILLKGDKDVKDEISNGEYIRRELKRSAFQRSFVVDSHIFKLDEIKAAFDNGILTLYIPKRESKKQTKRTIEIK
jgi:HSP20 family protein